MRRGRKGLILILTGLAVLLAACGGGMGQGGMMEGDPERGRQLFEQSLLGEAPGCSTCHSLEPGEVIVGPSLAGIRTHAAERVQDPSYTGNARSAEGYIRESILHPDAYVAEGFPAGVMYQNYRSVLSMGDVNDLVAFLMTLE